MWNNIFLHDFVKRQADEKVMLVDNMDIVDKSDAVTVSIFGLSIMVGPK